MIGWEYLLVSLPTFEGTHATPGHSAAVDALNHEGTQGWEAVGMSNLPDGTVAVLLKRRPTDDHESRRGRPGRPTS